MENSDQQKKIDEDNKQIEMWKIKRLIKKLDTCRGNGTSVVTLIMPPKKRIDDVMKLLTEEIGAAQHIKSRVTKQSVCTAITSTQQKLKLYKNVPENGLAIFCGVITMEDGKSEKKINIDLVPFKPLDRFAYNCDGSFHTEPLHCLLSNDDKFGFIVVDGNGVLYANLEGNIKTILQKISVELPKKHGRGGQSAVRFARLREEKRHNYLRKVAETATTHFITDNMPNVKGLILAGSAQFKNDLSVSDMFDKRLSNHVIQIVDVSYGGENGLNQAINLAAEALSNVKFVQERKLICKFFENIAMDTGMVVFGVEDTLTALEMGSVEQLLLFEEIEVTRYQIKNPVKGTTTVHYLNPQQESDPKYFKDKESGIDMEVLSAQPLAEWLCEHYKDFGATIDFITDKSQEGYQFVKGFGGVGGFLRYKLDMELHQTKEDLGGDDFDAEEDFI